MNKEIEEAIAKGKVIREEIRKKQEEDAKKMALALEVAELKRKMDLQDAADKYLSKVPQLLTEAVAKQQSSFELMTYGEDNLSRFETLTKLIEPRLNQMGLHCKQTRTNQYVIYTYDPDTGGYEAFYHLEVLVPKEGL